MSSGTNLACLGDFTSIDTIRVDDNGAAGHNATVTIVEPNDFAPGATDENPTLPGTQGEIEFNDIDLGDGGDFVELVADSGGDSFVFGSMGINTNPVNPILDTNDADIFISHVFIAPAARRAATPSAGWAAPARTPASPTPWSSRGTPATTH